MSADTPECTKLNHLKIPIFGGTCSLTRWQCIARPPIFSNMYKYRFTPLMYALDLCRQSNIITVLLTR